MYSKCATSKAPQIYKWQFLEKVQIEPSNPKNSLSALNYEFLYCKICRKAVKEQK